MADNPNPSSDTSNNDQNLKGLLFKGIVGAVSLVGATAIPLLVQRALNPSPSAETAPQAPAQVVPAQAVPTQTAPAQAVPAQDQAQPATALQQPSQTDEQPEKGKGKKKSKSKD